MKSRAPVYNRGSSRFVKTLFFMIVVAFILWAGGLYLFASAIPAALVDDAKRTDAIVVLTGGSGRLNEGVRLLSERRAERLFVSGVYRGVDVATLLKLSQQKPAELSCCIGIGYAEDTIDNARETLDWVRDNRVKSLRLVTSAYHMQRALLEFSNTLPFVEITPHPVFSDFVKQESWWKWPGTTDLIVSEYNKYLLAWMRHRLRTVLVAPPQPN